MDSWHFTVFHSDYGVNTMLSKQTSENPFDKKLVPRDRQQYQYYVLLLRGSHETFLPFP